MTSLLHYALPLSDSAPAGDPADALERGVALERREDLAGAEAAFREADALGDAEAALRLGILLSERDDAAGAEDAFLRAADRGHADGAFHLGWALRERGDLAGAAEAYRWAAAFGHPGAAGSLRALQRTPELAPTASRPAPDAPAPRTPAPFVISLSDAVPDPLPDAAGAAVPGVGSPAVRPGSAELGHNAARSRTALGGRARRPLRALGMTATVAAFAAAFVLGTHTTAVPAVTLHPAAAVSAAPETVTISRLDPVPAPRALAGGRGGAQLSR